MAAVVPQKLQTIAAIQIVSGVVNGLFMSGIVTTALFTVIGTGGSLVALCSPICPLFALAPCASVCGFWGLGLLPIGLVEVLCGVAILLQPDSAKTAVNVGMMTELASILFGGIGSFVAGMVVRNLITDPEVAGFLESGGQG
jgi:uncharacterized protein YjeT (DUF2065 family)